MIKHKLLTAIKKGGIGTLLSLLLFILLSVSTHGISHAALSINDLSDNEGAWAADGNITFGTTNFFFDLTQTVAQNKIIFREWDAGNKTWLSSGVTLEINADGSEYTATKGSSTATGNLTNNERADSTSTWRVWAPDSEPDQKDTGQIENKDINKDGIITTLGEGNDVHILCGLKVKKGQKCYNGAQGPLIEVSTTDYDTIKAIRDGLETSIEASQNCSKDAGSLGFIFCPLVKLIRSSIEKLIGSDGSGQGYLVELLTIKPLKAVDGDPLYVAWKGIRDIALGLFVLVFIVIIFGNGLGVDAYTIKRTLPRLAVASLMTFTSFYILQFLVDLSNILGNALPALLNNLGGGLNSFKIDLDTTAQGVAILLMLVLALAAFIAVIVGVVGLIMRQLIIFILVLAAPLAFLAWTLPNTEKLFKKWWSNLIRVLMMFPIVTGMLSASMLFQTIASNTSQSFPVKLAGALAPMIALMFIPKTFKWGGDLFAAAAGFAAGYATKASDFGKDKGKGAVGRARSRAISNRLAKGKTGNEAADEYTKKAKDLREDAKALRGNNDIAGAEAKERQAMQYDEQAKIEKKKAIRARRAGVAMAGRLPTKQGVRAAAVKARSYEDEEAKAWGASAQYMSTGEINNALDRIGTRDTATANTRRSALLGRLVETGNFKDIARQRKKAEEVFNKTGDRSAINSYNQSIMPHLGAINEKAADLGLMSIETNADGRQSIKGFDINKLSAERLATQHDSTWERWADAKDARGTSIVDTLEKGKQDALLDPRISGRMSGTAQKIVEAGTGGAFIGPLLNEEPRPTPPEPAPAIGEVISTQSVPYRAGRVIGRAEQRVESVYDSVKEKIEERGGLGQGGYVQIGSTISPTATTPTQGPTPTSGPAPAPTPGPTPTGTPPATTGTISPQAASPVPTAASGGRAFTPTDSGLLVPTDSTTPAATQSAPGVTSATPQQTVTPAAPSTSPVSTPSAEAGSVTTPSIESTTPTPQSTTPSANTPESSTGSTVINNITNNTTSTTYEGGDTGPILDKLSELNNSIGDLSSTQPGSDALPWVSQLQSTLKAMIASIDAGNNKQEAIRVALVKLREQAREMPTGGARTMIERKIQEITEQSGITDDNGQPPEAGI